MRGDPWMRYLSDDYPDNCRPIDLQSLRLGGVDELIKSLGHRIRELRVQRGWSQEEFADVCGVHRTYMGHLERGEKNVSFSSLVRVAAALSLPISELFTDLERAGTAAKDRPQKPPRGNGGEALNKDTLLKKLAVLERGVASLKEVILRSGQPSRKSGRPVRSRRQA
jgi:transcriptional regulator with XRE-family HTH domain